MNDVMNRSSSLPENGYSDPEGLIARGQAIQQVRSSYATAVAVQKPRRMTEVQRRLTDEAMLAGEDFYYGWGAGKNSIEGPSVGLALAAARCWGNCAVEALPVQDLADSWVFTSAFVDLETGFTLTRQFRQSKRWTVHGKLDDERKDDVRFQIGQSKSARNVVLNALPDSLIRRALQAAKEGVKQRVEQFVKEKGLPAAIDLVMRALAKVGVTEERVLTKLGLADRKAIDLDYLVGLRGDLTAIQGGQERAEDLYPAPNGEQKTKELKSKLKGEKKAESAPPEQQPEATPASDSEPPEGFNRECYIVDLRHRIADCTNESEVDEIRRELVSAHDDLGEEYDRLVALSQERGRAVRAKK